MFPEKEQYILRVVNIKKLWRLLANKDQGQRPVSGRVMVFSTSWQWKVAAGSGSDHQLAVSTVGI